MGQMHRFLVLRDGAPCVSRVCAWGGAQMPLRLAHLRISMCLTDALRPHLPASAAPGPPPRPAAFSELLARVRAVPGGCPGLAGSPGPASPCDCLPEETPWDVYLSRTVTRTQTPCRHISELKARGGEVKNRSAACPGQLCTPRVLAGLRVFPRRGGTRWRHRFSSWGPGAPVSWG